MPFRRTSLCNIHRCVRQSVWPQREISTNCAVYCCTSWITGTCPTPSVVLLIWTQEPRLVVPTMGRDKIVIFTCPRLWRKLKNITPKPITDRRYHTRWNFLLPGIDGQLIRWLRAVRNRLDIMKLHFLLNVFTSFSDRHAWMFKRAEYRSKALWFLRGNYI